MVIVFGEVLRPGWSPQSVDCKHSFEKVEGSRRERDGDIKWSHFVN